MKTKLDPITIVILSILLGWGWTRATTDDRPVCQVQEIHNGQTVLVPHYCDEVIKE